MHFTSLYVLTVAQRLQPQLFLACREQVEHIAEIMNVELLFEPWS